MLVEDLKPKYSSEELSRGRMLNLMWSQDCDIIIKEEQDHCSDRSSPRLIEQIHGAAYHDLNYGVTVTLTPTETDGYEYLEPEESSTLQTLQPLPSFHSLPSSPSRKQLDFVPVSIHDFVHSSSAHSPDSSGQPSAFHPTPPQESGSGPRRRKRTNSGSSGCSNTSSTSKATKRRRPPISHDELMLQRNQANVRERQRTKNLNDAFSTLREIVPTLPSDKLSKIQTLRLASRYIDFLNNILNDTSPQSYESRTGIQAGVSVREELSHQFNVWRMDLEYRAPGNVTPDL